MGSRSQYGPAAGAKGGPEPRLASLRVPEYLRLDHGELRGLWDVLRDPLVSHVYGLLQMFSDFKTGEFLGTYARLKDLCTPPAPEKGRRREGPTYKQLRRAIDDLVAIGLAQRADTNREQGQLRIYMRPRYQSGKSKLTPRSSAGRV